MTALHRSNYEWPLVLHEEHRSVGFVHLITNFATQKKVADLCSPSLKGGDKEKDDLSQV